jgi:hypothetical protein
VILHLRYTAREGGDALREAATQSVNDLLAAQDSRPLLRLFSLRQEFPSEWHRFVAAAPSTSGVNAMTLDFSATRFPYLVQNRDIKIKRATVVAATKSNDEARVGIAPERDAPPFTAQPQVVNDGRPGLWTFGTDAEPREIEEVFVIFEYSASQPNP